MALEDLDNKLGEILTDSTPVEEVKEIKEEASESVDEQDVIENSEVEGVEEAAETSKEEAQKEDEGGDNIPPELEDELKNIDPDVRESILNADPKLRDSYIKSFKKMRASVDRKLTEFGKEKKIAETTKDLFKKYNLDEVKGFDQLKNLVEFEKKLKQDPKSVIKSLQDMFKVEDVKSGSEKEIDIEEFTDNELTLHKQIKKIEEEANKAKEEFNNIKRVNENREQELLVKEIISVRDATLEDGSLKNPYFEELIPDMENLSGLYPNLSTQQLYNKALRVNDDIYEKSIADRTKKDLSEKFLEKEEAIKKAKNINSQSLKHKSSSVGPDLDLDDILGNILDKS